MEPAGCFKNAYNGSIDYLNIEPDNHIRFEAPNFYSLRCYLAWLTSTTGKGTKGSITLIMAIYLSDSRWCHLSITRYLLWKIHG